MARPNAPPAHRLGVEHRQHAGHGQVDGIGLGVRLGAEGGGLPEKIFERVASCRCTSRPMTISQLTRPPRQAAAGASRALLVRCATASRRASSKCGRSAAGPREACAEAGGKTHGRQPGEVYRQGVDVLRYMAVGSSVLDPRAKATPGVVGPAITSTCSKAAAKSSVIRRRTCCAFL
jgi:hypothetical protein